MAQFSVKIMGIIGSVLVANQQLTVESKRCI